MKKGLIAGVLSLMIAGTACVQAFAAETVGKNGQIYQPGDTVMIDENATEAKFEAVWGAKVIFQDYDGTILSEQIVEVGENAKRPQSPTREGYTFVGWSGDYTNIQAETTIQAVYQKNAPVSTDPEESSQNGDSNGNQQGGTGNLPTGGTAGTQNGGNEGTAMNTPRPSTSSESSASSQDESVSSENSNSGDDEEIGDESTPTTAADPDGNKEEPSSDNSWMIVVYVAAGVIVVAGGATAVVLAVKKKKQA